MCARLKMQQYETKAIDSSNSEEEDKGRGKVYVASMDLRKSGKRPDIPEPHYKLNVTSAQSRNNPERIDFSPMHPVPYTSGNKVFFNFEVYWQSGKVFEGIEQDESVRWWHSVASNHRGGRPRLRRPGSGQECWKQGSDQAC